MYFNGLNISYNRMQCLKRDSRTLLRVVKLVLIDANWRMARNIRRRKDVVAELTTELRALPTALLCLVNRSLEWIVDATMSRLEFPASTFAASAAHKPACTINQSSPSLSLTLKRVLRSGDSPSGSATIGRESILKLPRKTLIEERCLG